MPLPNATPTEHVRPTRGNAVAKLQEKCVTARFLCTCLIVILLLAVAAALFYFTQTGEPVLELFSLEGTESLPPAARLAQGLVGAGLVIATLAVAHRLLTRILDTGTPFEVGVMRNLKSIARLTWLIAIVPGLTGALAAGVLAALTDSAFEGGFGSFVSPPFVLAALLLELLVCVFEYGYVLQQQDDELV